MACAKDMRDCGSLCRHRQLVEGYRLTRIDWEQQLENTACGWAAEERDFREQCPPPTFREWLIQNGGAAA